MKQRILRLIAFFLKTVNIKTVKAIITLLAIFLLSFSLVYIYTEFIYTELHNQSYISQSQICLPEYDFTGQVSAYVMRDSYSHKESCISMLAVFNVFSYICTTLFLYRLFLIKNLK